MSPARYPEDFDQRFNRTYGMVAYIASRHYGYHLRRILVELNLDLESAFILGLLSQLNVATELTPGTRSEEVLDGTGRLGTERMKPIRLVDLAQISGLPRETVRRKLERLRALGKVARTPEGGWKLSDGDDDAHFRAFIRETVVRLLSVAREINGVLGHRDP